MTLAYMLVGNIASQKKNNNNNNKRAGWFSLKKEFFP